MIWPASDRWRTPLHDFPPRWATAWGDDVFGLWAELVVVDAAQRLRWIEPTGPYGFLMGSPAAERAALSDPKFREWADAIEHDPRRVVVADGYWLADTPCTQAFWTAVMSSGNPSHFARGDDAHLRPVEQVSWDDVQGFLAELRRRCPPLLQRATLPSEVQWEYAARAGTDTAYPWGDKPDDARANWDEQRGGTTAVGRFAANPWGLFDMHGNVFEWCADSWAQRLDQSATYDAESPHGRALRGGSWIFHPGSARSAYRGVWHPGGRRRDLGFRLALRSSSPVQAR